MEVGPNLFTDIARTVILMVGFALAMACLKFAILAHRHHEGFRSWGLASYALIVITPSLTGLYRYDGPMVVISTVTYALGLACGIMGLRTSYTLNPEWRRMRAEGNRTEAR